MSNLSPPALCGHRHKFFADVMLGSLARWLRILGFDTCYDNRIEDVELVERCLREDRVALTRDRGLVRRRALKQCLLVEGNALDQQLSEVFSYTDSTVIPGLILTRCVECNLPIETIEKSRIQKEVPAFVYRSQSLFRRCPGCRRVYWAGTHRERILDRLQELIGPFESGETGISLSRPDARRPTGMRSRADA